MNDSNECASCSAGWMERLARWLDRYDTDRLIRHSAVVIFFTNIGSAANLLFHVMMGHLLSEAAYAVLASMLGVYLIFTTPTTALQNTLAHFSACLKQEGREGDIWRLARQWLFKVSLVLIPLFAAGCLSASFWQHHLHLETAGPVLLVAGMIFLNYYLPVFVGALQGVQAFTSMCVAANIWALIRIVAAVGLVMAFGALAVYGLVGHLLGMALSLLTGIWLFNRLISKTGATTRPLEKTDRYLSLSMLALFCFSVLMTGDVVLIKMLFPDQADYGPYSRASTIARVLIFLSQPIANALFPKVISRGGRSAEHAGTLWKAIALSSLIIGLAVVFCVAFPRIPLFLLYHVTDADPHLVALVRWVSVAMAPLGVAYILLNFEMAQHRFTAIPYLLAAALGLVGGAWVFHQTPAQFIAVYALASYGATAGVLFAVFQSKRRSER